MNQPYGPVSTKLVNEFWEDVEGHLRSRLDMPGEECVRSILRYRNELDRVGPLIYHRQPRDVADDIVSGGYARTGRQAG